MPSLSKMRQTMSRQVQNPAAVITLPSPPGTWKAWPSARVSSRMSTAAATRSTAASTKEKAPQPVSELLAERRLVTPLANTVS